jgi:hypothetical protein
MASSDGAVRSDSGAGNAAPAASSSDSSDNDGLSEPEYEFKEPMTEDEDTLGESEPEDDDAGETVAEMNLVRLGDIWLRLIDHLGGRTLVMPDGEEVNVAEALEWYDDRQLFDDLIVESCLMYHQRSK